MNYRYSSLLHERRYLKIQKSLYLTAFLSFLSFLFFPAYLVPQSLIFIVCMRSTQINESAFDESSTRYLSETVELNSTSLIFTQGSTGYKFAKNHDQILSAKLSNFLGVPRVKVEFKNNEEYVFKWLENAELFQKELAQICLNNGVRRGRKKML